MSSLIRMFGIGGCGINLVSEYVGSLNALGDGFAKVEESYMDTSLNNISSVPNGESKFHLVTSKSLTKGEISGSGGERKTHATDIAQNVKEYLDKLGIKKSTHEYAVVVFSTSGGSGSTAGPFLVKNLLEKNIPTVVIMIGDTTAGLSTIHTLNTIKSLDGIAKGAKKPLSVVYVNNETYISSGGIKQAMKIANKHVFNTMCALSLFLSGDNNALDAQDMINMIDQSNYTSLPVPPGLYGLNGFSKDVVIPEGSIGIGVRTLYQEGESPDVNFTPWHTKYGVLTEPNVIDKYKDMTPIHLVSYTNFFTSEVARIEKLKVALNNAMNAVEIDDIAGNSKADEDGMVW